MAKNVKNPSGYHSSGRTLKDKANNFGSFVKQFGWGGCWKEESNGNIALIATRGDNEEIEIIWYKTPQPGEPNGEVWYTFAGQSKRCHNVAEAAKIAQSPPDPNTVRKAIRSKRQENGEMTPEMIESLQGSLPFDHESSDEELKLVLFHKDITWINRLSGRTRSAMIGGRRHFKVVRREDKHDYIDFVSVPPRGEIPVFYAVYLDSIVSVG
jgi:hypothetical protein